MSLPFVFVSQEQAGKATPWLLLICWCNLGAELARWYEAAWAYLCWFPKELTMGNILRKAVFRGWNDILPLWSRRRPRASEERWQKHILTTGCNTEPSGRGQDVASGRNYLVVGVADVLSSCFHEGRTTGRDASFSPALPGVFNISLSGINSSPVSTNFTCGAGSMSTAWC